MKKTKFLSLLAIGFLGLGAIVACGPTTENPNPNPGPGPTSKPEPELETVKVGLHTNLGAGAGYSALAQGFMEEEGINMEPVMGAGPALATQVMNGDIQVSFMGGGVAYNYWVENPQIKLIALDNLTDDDRLFANPSGPGKDLTIESSLEEIGNALKGASIALDTTQTPATFLTTLINGVNDIMPDGQDIWYEDTTGKQIPNDLPSYNPECKMEVSHVDSASAAITATSYDFVIAFAPSATLIEQQGNMNLICRTSTHFAENDDYKPSTWAVNIEWLENNEETFKKFMRGLVKGMNFRRDNTEETCKDIEETTAGSVAADSLDTTIAIWIGDKEQIELYENGKMNKYAQNILDNDRKGGNADKVSPDATVEKCADFSYLYEAAKEVLGE